jgi:hypothetical protein
MRALAAPEADLLALVRKHLKPAEGKAMSAEALAKLVQELDDDAFAVRQKAREELERQGKHAEQALRKALAGSPSAELKRSAEALLKRLGEAAGLDRDALRVQRALEVLGWSGSAEAHRALTALAKGRPGAPLTLAAESALRRIDRTRR